jgi:hypothetical protein
MPFEKTLEKIAEDKVLEFIDLFIGDDEVIKLEVVKRQDDAGYDGTFTIK